MQGMAGLGCAPGVPQPDQFHRHCHCPNSWNIVTGPVDIFLAAVGQQIPKGYWLMRLSKLRAIAQD